MTTPALRYGDRKRLPARRKGYNQKIVIHSRAGRVVVHLRTGEYPDGTLGEFFADVSSHADPGLRAMVNMWCVAVSLALQHGCPLDTLADMYTFTKFEPSGPVKGHSRLRMCTSIADAIFRDLAISYLDRQDLAHCDKPDD